MSSSLKEVRSQWVLVVFLEKDVLSHPIPLEEVEDASGRNGVEADLQERDECRAPDDAEGIMRSAVIVKRSENRKELVEFYNCVMEIIKREKQEAERKNKFWNYAKKIVKVVVVGGLAVAAPPLALSLAGFSTGGIVAGSLAARLMSVAAIANGGGVAAASAGGLIAALQSAGAAGLSVSTNALIGSTARGACAMLDREKPPEGQWVLVVFLEEDVLSHPIPLGEVEDASGRNGVEADLQQGEECRARYNVTDRMRRAVIVGRSENREELVDYYNREMKIVREKITAERNKNREECMDYYNRVMEMKQTAKRKNKLWKKIALGVAVGGLAVAAAPLVLSVAGFSSGGIAAGSLAAGLMSKIAKANGGGVAAGSLFSSLQSAGVKGLSTSTNLLIGSTAGAACVILNRKKTPKD